MCCILEDFVRELQEYLTGHTDLNNNIIRIHSRKLNELGDISFPLHRKNWYKLLDNEANTSKQEHIFNEKTIEEGLEALKIKSSSFKIIISSYKVIKNDAHIFIERENIYKEVVKTALLSPSNYGKSSTVLKNINLNIDDNIQNTELDKLDLTSLRVLILKDVTEKLLKFTHKSLSTEKSAIHISASSCLTNLDNSKCILCGPVINEKGVKDNSISAQDLYNKRASDMRMMAQHKYGVQITPNADWNEYFKKLGVASVTIEMLSNKPHKSIQIVLNDLRTANKGSSFIFYNCARLAALFREFDKRVEKNTYPALPEVEKIDFSLLNQQEEWELLYVYILQFPWIIKNSVKDIENGKLNPQYLVTFLSNLSSVFSVYYRRIRILTDPREHLYPIIHSRMYLLKALHCVFHNALNLMNIEPIKEM